MRKVAPFTNWEILVTLFLLILFLLWQLRVNAVLSKEFAEKREKAKKIQSVKENLADLTKKTRDLKERKDRLYKKAPVNEEQPLSLIKALIKTGSQIGLKNITVGLKEETEEAATIKTSSGSENQTTKELGLKATYLEMDFEAAFPQLTLFLEKLMKLERVVSVEGIKIERNDKSLPYQKVSLDLATYIFQE